MKIGDVVGAPDGSRWAFDGGGFCLLADSAKPTDETRAYMLRWALEIAEYERKKRISEGRRF